MKALFVCSGNKNTGISPIIKAQGESLIKAGVDIDFFPIYGKGLSSYIKHIFILKKYLRINKFDCIHAHYSLSGYVAALAGSKPLVVSLMGSNITIVGLKKILIYIFYFSKWNRIIVKSKTLANSLNFNRLDTLPNGVDFSVFKQIRKLDAILKVGWDPKNINILFASDPHRKEKNFALAHKSVSMMNDENIYLHYTTNVKHNDMLYYYNAADILLLTSNNEGSPNVVKEALACNCPVVATDVGDVKEHLANIEGCYVTSFSPEDIATKLKKALVYEGIVKSRDKINYLSSENIARKLILIYQQVVSK